MCIVIPGTLTYDKYCCKIRRGGIKQARPVDKLPAQYKTLGLAKVLHQ